jgi:tRNA-dihydrouridine synthase
MPLRIGSHPLPNHVVVALMARVSDRPCRRFGAGYAVSEMLASDPRRRDLLCSHLEAWYAFDGELGGVRIARKHVGWAAASLPGGAGWRGSFNALESAAAQLDALRRCFDQPGAGPGEREGRLAA